MISGVGDRETFLRSRLFWLEPHIPLYDFHFFNDAGVGNGFDFVDLDTAEEALERARSQLRWRASHSVEVYVGQVLVGALPRSSEEGREPGCPARKGANEAIGVGGHA